MPRVLLLETLDDEATALLTRHADVALAPSTEPADAIATARAGPVHAVMTRGKGRVTAELMDACDGLVAVARCGVGLDNVDIPGATARAVRVLNLPGCNAQTIAEHTLMLMLAVGRGLVDWANAVRDGRWADRGGFDRDELAGKTVGIVGLGDIGTRVATMCDAIGMHVVFTSRSHRETRFERVSLDDLLVRADVVTLHCALTDQTRGLIGARAIGSMKPGAILINTARGAIIDQPALTDALRRGYLGGFGADVLDAEPPAPDDPLLTLPNVVLTPHVASLTRSTYRDICVRSARNVLGVRAGEQPMPRTLANARELAS